MSSGDKKFTSIDSITKEFNAHIDALRVIAPMVLFSTRADACKERRWFAATMVLDGEHRSFLSPRTYIVIPSMTDSGIESAIQMLLMQMADHLIENVSKYTDNNQATRTAVQSMKLYATVGAVIPFSKWNFKEDVNEQADQYSGDQPSIIHDNPFHREFS